MRLPVLTSLRVLKHYLLLLMLLAALAPRLALAETQYRIAGSIVSAIDHQPLQRATVEILTTDESKVIQSTTSDEYGRFAFTGVPAATFTLRGSAPGYLRSAYQDHGGFSTGIVTGAGVDTESLVLELRPESTIAGSVVDEAAEPVEHATVRLFRQSHALGDDRILPAQTASTNDLGRFEFPRLQPGTYFLAVTAKPWYAVHPEAQMAIDALNQQPGQGAMVAPYVDPALDVAYPVTYYPGTTDSSASAPIVLRGGESLDLHFQLSPQPAVTVVLPRNQPQGKQSFPLQLRRSLFGQLEPVAEQEIRQAPAQGFVPPALTPGQPNQRIVPMDTIITGLAPGDYYLSDSPFAVSQAGDATPLRLTEHQTTATLPEPSARAHVHITLQTAHGTAHGTALPSYLRVGLAGRQGAATTSQLVDPRGHAELEAPPGDYSFQVEGGPSTIFIRQVLSGEQALPANQIHLAAGDSRFYTLTILAGIHTLKGIAEKDGKPCPGAFILVFPAAEAHDIRTAFRQQSDLDGSWSIASLGPGSYTVIAIDDGWDLDWRTPGVLARYLPAALTVQVPDSTERIQKLAQPLAVQSR
jgi:hypothetical protein